MTHRQTNVGRIDALARRTTGALAVLGGLMSLDWIFRPMGGLTWMVLAFTFTTGLFFLMGGLRGGMGYFGLLLMLISVADAWLALIHQGAWALLLGVVVAADGFITAEFGSPLNRLLHKDTHEADRDWIRPRAGVH
jgi:hypothetical protein